VLIAAGIYVIVRWRRRNAYRRAALAAMQACGERFDRHRDAAQLATECSELLRRVALAAYGCDVAGIGGKQWLQFLDASMAGKRFGRRKNPPTPFITLGPALLQAPYRPGVSYDTQLLQSAIRYWIRHHRPGYRFNLLDPDQG
jgi:hypothetical protein